MSKEVFNHSQNPIIPKENNMGMDGMDSISMSNPHLFIHSRNAGNDWEWMEFQGLAMTDFHSGATVLCPTCKTRTFIQDAPWKLQCVTCYLARKGKTEATTPPTTAPIPTEMLRRLVQLCHPDRHGNSEAANTATRYLLALKGGAHG